MAQWSKVSGKGGIKEEIQDFLQDADFQDSGALAGYLIIWANRVNNAIQSSLQENPFLYVPQGLLPFKDDQERIFLPDDYMTRCADDHPVANGTPLTPTSLSGKNRIAPWPKSFAEWPSEYSVDGRYLYLNPIPNDNTSTNTVTGTDSNYYKTKNDTVHIATAKNKPITGEDYATYWTADGSATSGETWAAGKVYGHGCIFPYYRKPLQMADTEDNGSDTFTGSGLDDITVGTDYTGDSIVTYRVQIDGTGTPDTFKWSKDDGLTWEQETVNVSTSAVTLEHGLTVLWAANTGHTSGDYWEFTTNVPDGIPYEFHSVIVDGVTEIALEWLNESQLSDKELVKRVQPTIMAIQDHIDKNKPSWIQIQPRMR